MAKNLLTIYKRTEVNLAFTYTANALPTDLTGKVVGFHIVRSKDEIDYNAWFSDESADAYGSVLTITDEDAGQFEISIKAEYTTLIPFENGTWYLTVDGVLFGKGDLKVVNP